MDSFPASGRWVKGGVGLTIAHLLQRSTRVDLLYKFVRLHQVALKTTPRPKETGVRGGAGQFFFGCNFSKERFCTQASKWGAILFVAIMLFFVAFQGSTNILGITIMGISVIMAKTKYLPKGCRFAD